MTASYLVGWRQAGSTNGGSIIGSGLVSLPTLWLKARYAIAACTFIDERKHRAAL
jgi:hypothetical protein